MAAAHHARASFGPQKEVTGRHLCESSLPSDVAPSLETLIRKLVAQARDRLDAPCKEGNNDGEGKIIIDTEVDRVRCLLTQLEKSSPSRVSFSPRESEIARLVAKGYPNKTIAAVLEISSWTVCTHLRRIFAKLGVSPRAAMVARMMDTGVLGRVSGQQEHRRFGKNYENH